MQDASAGKSRTTAPPAEPAATVAPLAAASLTPEQLARMPRLVTEHGVDLASQLDADPEAGEALADLLCAAASALDVARAAEAEIDAALADRMLSAEGQRARASAAFARARAEAARLVVPRVERERQNLALIEADIAQAGRPSPGAGEAAIVHELRVQDARRALEALEHAARIQLVLDRAGAGDPVPLDAAERSYRPLVPPEVVAMARERLGLASRADLGRHREAASRRVALAERVSAETLARVDRLARLRGLDVAPGRP